MPPVRLLGLDPGTARCGWAILEGEKALQYGTWVTTQKTDLAHRLFTLSKLLQEVIDVYHPDIAAVESLFFGTNRTTAMAVSQARGALLLTCAAANMTIIDITPQQAKLTVTGDGHAKKPAVQMMITRLLHLDAIPQPDDTADALAIAWTGQHLVQWHSRIAQRS